MNKIHILQITKDCNQDCFYCCRDVNGKEKSLQDIKEDLLKLDSVDQGIVTGGEPTLKKELPEIIRLTKKFIKHVHVQTNGINFNNREYCKTIVDSGMDSVLVALPTFSPHKFMKIANTKDFLEEKLNGLKYLARFYNLKTGVVFVPNKINYKEFPDYVKKIANISRDIYIQMSYPVDYNKEIEAKKKEMVKYSELSPFLKKGASICKQKNMELRIDGVPLCFLPSLKNINVSDLRTRKYDFVEDFIDKERERYDSDNYRGKEHMKTEECKYCQWSGYCKGIYKHYANVFGIEEIKHL